MNYKFQVTFWYDSLIDAADEDYAKRDLVMTLEKAGIDPEQIEIIDVDPDS